eukprot:scaffold155773_cov21-Tisochrysis_lutea.AAC.1
MDFRLPQLALGLMKWKRQGSTEDGPCLKDLGPLHVPGEQPCRHTSQILALCHHGPVHVPGQQPCRHTSQILALCADTRLLFRYSAQLWGALASCADITLVSLHDADVGCQHRDHRPVHAPGGIFDQSEQCIQNNEAGRCSTQTRCALVSCPDTPFVSLYYADAVRQHRDHGPVHALSGHPQHPSHGCAHCRQGQGGRGDG